LDPETPPTRTLSPETETDLLTIFDHLRDVVHTVAAQRDGAIAENRRLCAELDELRGADPS
jgi:hypothetical protein